MKHLAVLAVTSLALAALPALAGPAVAADQGAGAAPRSITVADPAGDVLDAGDTTRTRARKIDVTSATYEVRRNSGPQDGKRNRQVVTFGVDYGGYFAGNRFGCRERLVVTFTSGGLEYKIANGGAKGLQSRTPGGAYEPADTSYLSSGCGGSTTDATANIDIPAGTFRSGEISDIRATLRVGGTRARDVVEVSSDVLRFTPRTRL